MTRVVEADKNGTIHLSPDWLNSTPNARYVLDYDGKTAILRPLSPSPDFAQVDDGLDPESRVKKFRAWVRRQRSLPVHLTDEQLRRENIYED